MEMLSEHQCEGWLEGYSAHRQTRPVQLLRGIHSYRGFDVQPARQVVEGHGGARLAAQDRIAQLPAEFACLAPGSQRLHAPGPRLHRSRRQQEGGDRARVPAAGRQLPVVGDGSLLAQPPLRQRRDRRQASGTAMADDAGRDQALQRGHRHLAVGQQRSAQRARRGHGLRRRCAHAGDAGRRFDPAARAARIEGARGQCGRPHETAAAVRASAWPERQ